MVVVLAACGPAGTSGGEPACREPTTLSTEPNAQGAPALEPIGLADGEKLRVAATTGIVADVVSNVGGDAIELTTLIAAGSGPTQLHADATGPACPERRST